MKYEMAMSSKMKELVEKVNLLIQDGWELYGNPFCEIWTEKFMDTEIRGSIFCQAMIKKEIENETLG